LEAYVKNDGYPFFKKEEVSMREKAFAEEACRQSLAIANSPCDEDDLAFIDSLYESSEWDEG